MDLFEQATNYSIEGYKVSKSLVKHCPYSIGKEVLLTGSVSRGCADKYSDIEIGFFADKLPPKQERDSWLNSIRANNIIHDDIVEVDGSYWSTFNYKNKWFEVGWQTFETFESQILDITNGNTTNHEKLLLAWIVNNAIPLVKGTCYKLWKERLAEYPEKLEHRLVNESLSLMQWNFPKVFETRWALASRNDIFPLTERLAIDVNHILRILFAINRSWEPDWKWSHLLLNDLKIKPNNLKERINNIFLSSDPLQSIDISVDLIIDTVEIASVKYDTSNILKTIRPFRNVR